MARQWTRSWLMPSPCTHMRSSLCTIKEASGSALTSLRRLWIFKRDSMFTMLDCAKLVERLRERGGVGREPNFDDVVDGWDRGVLDGFAW